MRRVDELLRQSERLEAAGIEFLSGDAPARGCIREGGNEPNGLLGADMNDQETKLDKCPACRGTGSAPILQPVQPLGTTKANTLPWKNAAALGYLQKSK